MDTCTTMYYREFVFILLRGDSEDVMFDGSVLVFTHTAGNGNEESTCVSTLGKMQFSQDQLQ